MAGQVNPLQAGLQEPDKTSDLEAFVGYNLKRAYIVMQNDFRKALGQDGPSARVFSALSLTVQFPNITQSMLARKLGIERSGLVAIIDELEQLGHLKRTHVPGDRRVQALVPTEAGVAAYQSAVQSVRAHEASILAHLDKKEITMLNVLLKKIRIQGEDS